MDRNTVLGFTVGVVVALLVGYIVYSKVSEPSSAPIAPITGVQGAPTAPAMEQQIAATQAAVAQDPKNRQAWVELGNAYFDTHQRQKSIDAYAKALALEGNDANVLTDQGVMYRELGAFDKAAANFEKASKLDPHHMQSLFNLGIVYADDLKQPEKAKKAWNKIIETEPASPIALQARQALQRLDSTAGQRAPAAPFPPPAGAAKP